LTVFETATLIKPPALQVVSDYLPRGHIVYVQRFKAGRVIALTHEDCDRLDREPYKYVKRGVGPVLEVRRPEARKA
jgi:hypothetical protein